MDSTVLDLNSVQISDIQLPETLSKKTITLDQKPNKSLAITEINKVPLSKHQREEEVSSEELSEGELSENELYMSGESRKLSEYMLYSSSASDTTQPSKRQFPPKRLTIPDTMSEEQLFEKDSSESQNGSVAPFDEVHSERSDASGHRSLRHSSRSQRSEDSRRSHRSQRSEGSYRSQRSQLSGGSHRSYRSQRSQRSEGSQVSVGSHVYGAEDIHRTIEGLEMFKNKILASEFYDEEDVRFIDAYQQRFEQEQQRRMESKQEVLEMKRILQGRLAVLESSVDLLDFNQHRDLTNHFLGKQKKLEKLYQQKRGQR